MAPGGLMEQGYRARFYFVTDCTSVGPLYGRRMAHPPASGAGLRVFEAFTAAMSRMANRIGCVGEPSPAADNSTMSLSWLPDFRHWLALAVLALSACAPALDWREVRPAGGMLKAWLPCKPERREREVNLLDRRVSLELLSCRADGTTWGIVSAPWEDGHRIDAALDALRASRLQALEGRESARAPFVLRGRAPHAGAVRFTVEGHRPDGEAIVEHAVVFFHAGRIYHAAALGGAPAAQARETFFDNLVPRP